MKQKLKTKVRAGVNTNPTPNPTEATRYGDLRGNNNASVGGFVKARGRTLRLTPR